MSTDTYAAHPSERESRGTRSQRLRKWWSAITALLLFAIFMEAIFAGAMLSGVEWALAAHRATAAILILSALSAGLVALATFRRDQQGWKLGLILLSLVALIVVQAAAGALSAKGVNLLWLHVPLGVALFGVARLAVDSARRLPPA